MNAKWLIPVDGSEPALRALETAIGEAREHAATRPDLIVVNVQSALSADITRFVNAQAVDDFHRENGEAALAPARARLEASGLPFTAHILIGEAAPSIVRFAKEKGCTRIVMGAHGFGSVVGLFMGSVTVKVVHLAEIPVLLVK